MKIAGLTSGDGRALLAIGRRRPAGGELATVVTDDPDAPAASALDELGADAEVIAPGGVAASELAGRFEDAGVDLVVVDGFDPELPGNVARWPRTVETYPALVPGFADEADPVAAAHEAGVAVTGATVRELGGGAGDAADGVLAQQPVFVGGSSLDDLRDRVADAAGTAAVRTVREIAGKPDGEGEDPRSGASDDRLPATWLTTGDRVERLRYGENPHQEAALYADDAAGPTVVEAPQLNEGTKGMSYNNYNDADAALALAGEFDRPAAVVVKHANPAGCGTAPTLPEAYDRALSTDPMSAFGGVVALNRECDRETAAAVTDSFKEVVVAPGYTDGALSELREEDDLRVLAVGALPAPDERPPEVVDVDLLGGRLVQDRDLARPGAGDLEVVTERSPTDGELEAMLFAWRVVTHVTSNAIVFADGTETVGIGAGQMSRVDAVHLAARKAREHAEGKSAEGAVMASDAFFPFPDGVEAAAEAGVEAVIQPGGSVNDDEVIAAADDLGLAMALTGQRAFRHD